MSRAEILQYYIDRKKKNCQNFSLSLMAKKMKVSNAYINQIFHGKKGPSLARVTQMSEILDLNAEETHKLIEFYSFSRLKKDEDVEILKKRLAPRKRQSIKLTLSQSIGLLSVWYNMAILDLVTCANFTPTIQNISKKLNLPICETEKSVQFLIEIGLLKKENKKLIKIYNDIDFQLNDHPQIFRNFHKQMINQSIIFMQNHPEKMALREISGITFAADPNKLAEAKELIHEFKMRMADLLTSGEATQVYQFNIQLFPLSQ